MLNSFIRKRNRQYKNTTRIDKIIKDSANSSLNKLTSVHSYQVKPKSLIKQRRRQNQIKTSSKITATWRHYSALKASIQGHAIINSFHQVSIIKESRFCKRQSEFERDFSKIPCTTNSKYFYLSVVFFTCVFKTCISNEINKSKF